MAHTNLCTSTVYLRLLRIRATDKDKFQFMYIPGTLKTVWVCFFYLIYIICQDGAYCREKEIKAHCVVNNYRICVLTAMYTK